MHRIPWQVACLIITALLFGLSSCGNTESDRQAGRSDGTSAGQQGDVSGRAESPLRFSQGPEIATLDPHKMQAVGDGRIASALFEGLVVIDPKTSGPRPGVAKRWEISADKLVYTFYLRSDAKWSDGSGVTAEDFRYGWLRALDVLTGSPYDYMLYPIRGAREYAKATARREALKATDAEGARQVMAEARRNLGLEVVSPTQLRVTLKQPTHYFLELVAFETLLPAKRSCVEKVIDGRTVDREDWTKPETIVCNGPYILESWQYKRHMRLVRNPHYWNRENVRLEVIDVSAIEDARTVHIQYERGDLDFITIIPPLAVEKLIQLKTQGKRPDFYAYPYFATYFYRFNCTRRPFNDRRVRKALSLALDKQEIIDKAGRAGQQIANAFVPPGACEYQGPKGLTRNPDRARQLLGQAGFPGGKGFPEVTMLYNTSEGHKQMAELAQRQWKRELGIEVRLANLEWKVFLQRVTNLDYDIARAGWIGDYLDANTFLDMFVTGGGNNDTGWSNKHYDMLIEAAAAEADAKRRAAILHQAEAMLVEEELPILPIYHYVNSCLIRPQVKGYHVNPRNRILLGDLWIQR